LEEAKAPKPKVLVSNSAGIVPALSVALNTAEDNLRLFEDFVNGKTLKVHNATRNYVANVLWRAARVPYKVEDMVGDIPRTLGIWAEHGLSEEKIRASQIPCFVRLLNTKTHRTEAVDVRTHPDPWFAIEQTVSCEPIYRPVRRTEYIDPLITGERGYRDVLQAHADKRIIAIENAPGHAIGHVRSHLNNLFMGFLTASPSLFMHFARKESRRVRESQYIEREGDDIILVRPPDDFPVTSGTNTLEPLREGFSMGQRAGEQLVRTMQKEGLMRTDA
jgi:hypothetical protein